MTHSAISPNQVDREAVEELAGYFPVLCREEFVGQTPQLVGPDGAKIELPHELYDLLAEAVNQLRMGNGITLMPQTAELTTVQAAEMLNVSRPHLVSLIEAGRIPHRMVGTHRRVQLSDVVAYKAQDAAARLAVMEDLVDEFEQLEDPDIE